MPTRPVFVGAGAAKDRLETSEDGRLRQADLHDLEVLNGETPKNPPLAG